MRSLSKRSLAVALVGLGFFFKADFAVGSTRPKVPVSVQMGMTPQIPSLGETAEVVATIKAGPEMMNTQVFFGSYNGTLKGVELIGTPAVQTISFKSGETKEFRYKIKFVGPKEADVMVGVRVFEVRWGDGTVYNYNGLAKEAGYGLKLYEKDKKFYLPYTEPKDDPYADLQKELGLPGEGGEQGYWYSVALHLQDDLVRFTPAKGISYEEAKKILKDLAERMSREDKMEKSKAYETILTHRLLWKEAKLPDPFAVPPALQSKVLNLESDVMMVAHTIQFTVEDFKMTPGKEGIKPTSVRELKIPPNIIGKPNPFDPKQSYSPAGGALVDGYPRKPGQVGYIYKGQDQPYLIQALGEKGRVVVSLGEGN